MGSLGRIPKRCDDELMQTLIFSPAGLHSRASEDPQGNVAVHGRLPNEVSSGVDALATGSDCSRCPDKS